MFLHAERKNNRNVPQIAMFLLLPSDLISADINET